MECCQTLLHFFVGTLTKFRSNFESTERRLVIIGALDDVSLNNLSGPKTTSVTESLKLPYATFNVLGQRLILPKLKGLWMTLIEFEIFVK